MKDDDKNEEHLDEENKKMNEQVSKTQEEANKVAEEFRKTNLSDEEETVIKNAEDIATKQAAKKAKAKPKNRTTNTNKNESQDIKKNKGKESKQTDDSDSENEDLTEEQINKELNKIEKEDEDASLSFPGSKQEYSKHVENRDTRKTEGLKKTLTKEERDLVESKKRALGVSTRGQANRKR